MRFTKEMEKKLRVRELTIIYSQRAMFARRCASLTGLE